MWYVVKFNNKIYSIKYFFYESRGTNILIACMSDNRVSNYRAGPFMEITEMVC